MIGLLLKDCYALRAYFLRQFGLMVILYSVICISLRNMMMLPPMLILTTVMLLVSSFSVDETAQWNPYALTLPVNPRDIVRAKYVLFLGSMAVISVFSLLLCVPLNIFFFHATAMEVIATTLAVCAMYIPVCCICLPLFVKLGAEKARLYMTLAFLIPFFGVTFGMPVLAPLLSAMATPTPVQIALWSIIACLALAIMVVVSYGISVKLYESKEF